MPPQLFEFEQDEDGVFGLPEVNFERVSPDTGLRGAESVLPLPATQTLMQQEGSPQAQPMPVTAGPDPSPGPPAPRDGPPTGPPPPGGGMTPGLPNQLPFTLEGPLSKDRISPEQQAFMTAVGQAVRGGDQERLLSLFGREGTEEFGTFEDLSDPFVGNLALQAFPAVFSDRFGPDLSGAQRIQRIQRLLGGDTTAGLGQQTAEQAGFGSPGAGTGAPGGERRPQGGGVGGPGTSGPGGGVAAPGGGFPPGGGGAGPVPELPPPVGVPGAGGPTFPQLGGAGDEFSQVIQDNLRGLIEGQAFDPAQFGGPALAAGQGELAELAQTGGVDSDLIFNVEQSLRESLERQRQASQRTIDEELSGRRVSGAGLEAGRLADLEEGLFAQQATQLRDFATSIGLQGNQVRLSAAQALANQGLQERAQDISLFQQRTAQQLAALDLANERALGIGGLALQNLSLNSSFALAARQLQIDEAKFIENAKAARSGQITPMIGMLLQIANAMQAGFVD